MPKLGRQPWYDEQVAQEFVFVTGDEKQTAWPFLDLIEMATETSQRRVLLLKVRGERVRRVVNLPDEIERYFGCQYEPVLNHGTSFPPCCSRGADSEASFLMLIL